MNIANRKGNHESHLWQHNNLPFVFAAWNNNAVVKSLSNFHSPIIIQDGVQQRIKINKVRQRNPVGVPVPLQQKEYAKTFHKIDKGNSAKAKYYMGGNRYVYD